MGTSHSIIGKCRKNVNKALFYVHKTLENNWSTLAEDVITGGGGIADDGASFYLAYKLMFGL